MASSQRQVYLLIEVRLTPQKLTKRLILSEVAQIFDPLHFISPMLRAGRCCTATS